jgi:glycosyltransferase involved in cell wall biosynthesis
MTTFSFIICSHRAPDSILETLRSIFIQLDADDTEIILINNGFTKDKALELYSYAASFGKSKFFSIVNESKTGLGNARIKGFRSCSGSYLVLLDDDNYISPDFLNALRVITAEKPGVGGICPLVIADWETLPEKWLQDFGRYCLSYNASGEYLPETTEMEWDASQFHQVLRPPGGGMIINRIVADAYLKEVSNHQQRIDLSRQPDSLVGCEDYDLYSFVGRLSMSALITDRLRMFHRIPSHRTTMGYLVRLNFQMLRSFGMLKVFRYEETTPLYLLIYSALSRQVSCLRKLLVSPNGWEKILLLSVREIAYLVGVWCGRRMSSNSLMS